MRTFFATTLINVLLAVSFADVTNHALFVIDEQAVRNPRSGGEGTVFLEGKTALERPLANISVESRRKFVVGNSFFNQNWVTAPSSTEARDGLGPLFNARSCSSCHVKDGRGAALDEIEPTVAVLIRFAIPGHDLTNGVIPDPVYGDQLQTKTIEGVKPEGSNTVTLVDVVGMYTDGTPYTLRKPVVHITDLSSGPLHSNVMVGLRAANAVYGLGLLEAIAEKDLLALADENDVDGDGVSGRPNHVWDVEAGASRLGRFGWKANQPSIKQQIATAFRGDIGLTTSVFPTDNWTDARADELAALPDGGHPEVSDLIMDRILAYMKTLAPPARRHVTDEYVVKGERLFYEIRCNACHATTFQTAGMPGFPELENQTIHPYTDLLLHDMGKELDDGRPEFEAAGAEWRTPPLWGIGLHQVVNPRSGFLHDGRARTVEEAILWHGGEAQPSRDRFMALDDESRRALLIFIESL